MSDNSEPENQPNAEPHIEPAYEDEAEALDAFVKAPPPPVRRGLGWGVVLPLFLLAGLGGAVGGWALTQYVMPNYIPLPQAAAEAPKVNLDPLNTRLETVEKKLAAQSSEMSFLSSEIKSGSASVTVGGVDETLDITPLLDRIDSLEAQLNSPEPAMPVSNEDGAPLNANAYLKGYEERLIRLEKTMAETTPSPLGSQDVLTGEINADIDALKARLAILEESVAETRAMAATPTVIRDTVLLPAFPREALLEAMTAPRGQEGQSWMSRTLKKHISVRDPQEVARAKQRLDEVQALIDARDYAGALAIIEGLPSDVRSLASDWISAVKSDIQSR